MTGVLLNGLPAPSLKPIREHGRTVAVIDMVGRLYLPVGGTWPIPDIGKFLPVVKNPPAEIVKCDGAQFFPHAWVAASGLVDAAALAQRVEAIRATASGPIA